MLEGTKDRQSVTADWIPLVEAIAGVVVREVKNVPKDNGVLTEIFRQDWKLDSGVIEQVFQVNMVPGGISAWHTHRLATDRLFITQGQMKIVLFDGREDSPTRGRVNEFRFGVVRPALVIVPPGVWHGIQNLDPGPSTILNLVDRAYRYEDPDHWRLPADTPEIPYSFRTGRLVDGLR